MSVLLAVCLLHLNYVSVARACTISGARAGEVAADAAPDMETHHHAALMHDDAAADDSDRDDASAPIDCDQHLLSCVVLPMPVGTAVALTAPHQDARVVFHAAHPSSPSSGPDAPPPKA